MIEITSFGQAERSYITDRGAIVRDWIWWAEDIADSWGGLIIDTWPFPTPPRCSCA